MTKAEVIVGKKDAEINPPRQSFWFGFTTFRGRFWFGFTTFYNWFWFGFTTF